jgi:glycosyltransferase involved in cell wall biosynthesis
LRVAFDGVVFTQSRAGSARTAQGILDALPAVAPDIEIVPVGAGGFAGRGSARQKAAALRQDLAWYGDGLARAARRTGADLLHCPTFRAPLRAARLPVVVTVHDLAVLREPGWFPPWSRTYGRLLMPRAIRLADRVVCVSEATARDASGLLGVPDARLRVVPNGIDAVFSEPARTRLVVGPYILFVGTPEPRKNLERLASAVSTLLSEGRPERLVLAGADGWGGVELPLGDRVAKLGRVSDETLRDLYAHASCVAYPSLWEGFGLVAGEALAAGCPVVCSEIPALREVAGSDAEYCDPRSIPSIADALRRALDGPRPAARRELTWESAARSLAAVWRELEP